MYALKMALEVLEWSVNSLRHQAFDNKFFSYKKVLPRGRASKLSRLFALSEWSLDPLRHPTLCSKFFMCQKVLPRFAAPLHLGRGSAPSRVFALSGAYFDITSQHVAALNRFLKDAALANALRQTK